MIIRRSTHEMLWLVVKAVVVLALARATRNVFEWVFVSGVAIFFMNHWERMSREKHTKSELDERVDDRRAMEEKKRQENARRDDRGSS